MIYIYVDSRSGKWQGIEGTGYDFTWRACAPPALFFVMAKPAKKTDDDQLFEKAPEHLRKLNDQARKGLREDERRKWKDQNAHNDATDRTGTNPAR